MPSRPNPNFAALLDALMAEPGQERVQANAPSLRVDFLDQLERIQASNPALSGKQLVDEYHEMAAALEELEGVADRIGAREQPPSVDPVVIAKELGDLAGLGEKELARLRRGFAMQNHPDRLPDTQRDRAELRMRVANMLIDEAKRKIGTKRRR
jgi:hypothetical protein